LLFCRGAPPHASYLFKHALVQDTAYSTLLRRRRQELHARVAAALEQHFADLIERQPELLAHHLTAAGNTERAVDQWLRAGQHAAARLAYLEAIVHLERGLGLLHSLPVSPVRDGREIELQLALGLCLLTAKGAVEAKPRYLRAIELAESSGEPRQRFEALYGLWQSNLVSGRIAAASPLSDRLLRMTASEEDVGLRLQAHHSSWSTWLFLGDPLRAREHVDAGRRLYDPQKHASHRLLYGGHDPGVCAENIGALAEWLLGYPEKALATVTASLALAERISHPFTTLNLALTLGSVVFLNRREPEQALGQLDVAEALAAEQRLNFVAEPRIFRGIALLAQGAVDEALGRIREGVANWTRLGRTFYLPYGLAFLAEGLARHGDRAAALEALRQGLEVASATGEHMWDAELHRLTGTVLLAENELDEGQASLHEPDPSSNPPTSPTRRKPELAFGSTNPSTRDRWFESCSLHRRDGMGWGRLLVLWYRLFTIPIRAVLAFEARWTAAPNEEDSCRCRRRNPRLRLRAHPDGHSRRYFCRALAASTNP
jgi:predicted ATPase